VRTRKFWLNCVLVAFGALLVLNSYRRLCNIDLWVDSGYWRTHTFLQSLFRFGPYCSVDQIRSWVRSADWWLIWYPIVAVTLIVCWVIYKHRKDKL